MRTNIVIDDALLKEAMQATGLTTKRAVVEAGLRLLVQIKAQTDIRRLRGKPTSQVEWLEGAMGRQRLGLIDLVLCEVLQGVRDHQHLEEVSRALSRFAIFTTGGAELALAAARNYITLRRQGYTVR